MSYHRKTLVKRTRRTALDGVENCGANQVWDPQIEFLGQKGQCMPRSNYTSAQLENPNAFPTSVKVAAAASSSGGGIGKGIADLVGSLIANKVAPSSPQVMVAPSTGPSTGLIIGGVAVGLGALYLILKK